MLIETLVQGVILLFLLALAFLFSGFETGLISIDQVALESQAKRNKSRAQLLSFVRQPDKLLGTTLLGYNIVSILMATISTYMVHRIASPWFPARYTALALGTIVLLFGELMPKGLFRDHADTIVPRFFPILQFFYYLLKPLVGLVTLLNNSIKKLLKITDGNNFNYLTKDDLSYLLSQTTADTFSQPQMEMIEDALDFTEQEARNVMIPRTEIVAIPQTATIAEAIELARAEGFTRYPVYDQNIDNITGVLIIYDVLKKEYTPEMSVSEIAREPFFAPENTDLDVLLKEMQQQHRSIAIIVDPYGGTAGIVTMEDILEEIVGDIEDEYDAEDESSDVQQVSPNTWLAQADVEIDRLADEHGIELPEGDYETIAGLILDKLERIPHQGQFITVPPYRIQVLQCTDKKIVRVKIYKTE